jgi:hypothetical protein
VRLQVLPTFPFGPQGSQNLLENGGTLEVASGRRSGDSRTTKLYDRRGQKSARRGHGANPILIGVG